MAAVKSAHKEQQPASPLSIAQASGIDITGGKATAAPAADSLRAITLLAEEMRGIISWITETEKVAALKSQRLADIQTQLLPDRMMEAGMANFMLLSGETIKVEDVVRGSIPTLSSIENEKDPVERLAKVERRKAAFDWLNSNNAGSLIKTEVAASFGKGEGEKARKLAALIEKKGIPVLLEEAVHPGSLNKFLKETVAAGTEVPSDTFSLYTGKVAKLQAPRKKA